MMLRKKLDPESVDNLDEDDGATYQSQTNLIARSDGGIIEN